MIIDIDTYSSGFAASLALGYFYDFPIVSEVTLKEMSKIGQYQNTTRHSKREPS